MDPGTAKDITALVETMHAKKPANARLTAKVVVQVLSTKFAQKFEGRVANWADAEPHVESVIKRLDDADAAKKAEESRKRPRDEGKKKKDDSSSSSSSDDDDDDDDSSDDDGSDFDSDEESEEDEDSSSSEEEASGDEEGEGSSSDDDSDDDDDSSDSSDSDEDEEAKKKRKLESGAAATGSANIDVRSKDHIKAMIAFAQKLKLKGFKKPSATEEDGDLQEYFSSHLEPLYKENGLALDDLSSKAKSKYKMRQELKILESECDMSLDPSMRRGRALFGQMPASAVAAPRFQEKDDAGLFDDE